MICTMCSATTTKKTEDLVKVALKKEPIYIGIEEKSQVILTSGSLLFENLVFGCWDQAFPARHLVFIRIYQSRSLWCPLDRFTTNAA